MLLQEFVHNIKHFYQKRRGYSCRKPRHTAAAILLAVGLLPVALIAKGMVPSASAKALGNAGIRGKVIAVTDSKREPLAGVPVSIGGEPLKGRSVQTITDADGGYAFDGLASADYIVSVELKGFEKFIQKVSVPLDAPVDFNIELKMATVNEAVTIAADESEDMATESTVPSQVTATELRDVPLLNEKFQDALPLIPGVVRGPNGLLNVKGARASQSGILVSSLNVDDPVTGNSAIELPIEAVESVQVYANPYSAEFGRFEGAVTNVETRAGSNEWKYVVNNVLPRFRRRDSKINGIESVTPRVAVGGPLIKDKLFFLQSFEYRMERTRVPSLPDPLNDTRLESFSSFSRLDYNLNTTNRISASLSVFPQKLDYYNLNTFNSRESTPNLHQRGWFFTVNEQAAFHNGSLLQSSLSVKQYDVDVFGNSASPFTISPEKISGGWFDQQRRNSRRYEGLETYNLPTWSWHGQHTVKLGANISYTRFEGFDSSNPVRILRSDGTASGLETFVGGGQLMRNSGGASAFAQDKWKLGRRLTIDAGLRFDRDGIVRENNFAPRIAFVFLPAKDARTVVRGGVGLFYNKVPLNVGAFEQFQDMLLTSLAPDGVTPIGRPQLFRNVLENGGLKTPRNIAWNIQSDREVTKRLLVRLGYEERHTTRTFIINPEVGSPGDGTLVLSSKGSSRYRQLQVVTRYRLQEKHDIFFAYVRSRATGDLNDFGTYFDNFRNPIIRSNEYAPLPFDAPNRLLIWGDVGLPFGITAAPVIDWHNGFPYSLVDQNQNYVGPRNQGGRFPNFLSLDMQVTKDLSIPLRGKKYQCRVGLKVFNITNSWNPRDVQNNLASLQFGTFYNSVGRTFRAKFEILHF